LKKGENSEEVINDGDLMRYGDFGGFASVNVLQAGEGLLENIGRGKEDVR
jgi:hypothetical protein